MKPKAWFPLLAVPLAGWPAVADRTTPTSQSTAAVVEYIAHASFIVESPAGHRILLDPYASRVWIGYDFPAAVEMDAVLITHPHYDHDAGHYRGQPYPWDTTAVPVYTTPGTFQVGDITIRGIEGKHADPYGKEFGQINTIWIVETAGLRIAHIGDNGPLTPSNVREMGAVDMLMLPVDAQYHILSAAELSAIRGAVGPKWLVPMHYRIDELEPDPERPRDLGPIEPWLATEANVRRVGSRASFRADQRPVDAEVVVFRHSPRIPRP